MSFSNIGKDYIKEGFTMVDNVFIGNYLTTADATDSKVYIYGLFATMLDDNSIEKMAISLKLTEKRITDAYKYWESLGLVTISKTYPLKVTYQSVKAPITRAIKYNASDYSVFVEEMARIFPDKVLGENELISYVELMKQFKIDTNAMLMIAAYCLEIKAVASTPYILAVASDWAKQGITSEKDVSAHIEELEQNGEDIRQIFKALGLKSQAGLDDRQKYLYWTKECGLQLDAILVACRMCKKRGGTEKLSRIIDELLNAGATSALDIQAYAKSKEEHQKLAQDIIISIGGYYATYDMVVETYIMPWLNKGFDALALKTIAKFSFMRNIKTLDKVDEIVTKFYKLGLLTSDGINNYIDQQVARDGLVKEVLSHAGSNAFISNRDREYYRTFQEIWGFDHSVILLVADNTSGQPFPMTNINRTLAGLKERGIFDKIAVADYLANNATKSSPKKNTKTQEPKDDYLTHSYSKEQLSGVFSNLEDLDLNGGSDE